MASRWYIRRPRRAPAKGQTASSLITSAPIAFNVANKNVAENVARLILFSMLASVSLARTL